MVPRILQISKRTLLEKFPFEAGDYTIRLIDSAKDTRPLNKQTKQRRNPRAVKILAGAALECANFQENWLSF